MADTIQKIYDLKTIGYGTINQQLDTLNKQFEQIKKNKISLSQLKVTITDSAELAKLIQQQNEQIAQEKSLTTQLKEKNLQLKELQLLTKQDEANTRRLTQVKVDEARVRREVAAAAKAEIQLQQAQEQQARRTQAAIAPLAGSYNHLKLELRELYNQLKALPKDGSFTLGGTTYNYDAAIAKVKQLSAAEQNFRRQFTQDGTLVGEYTTGIIQAFKRMGLGDLVRTQVQQAKAALDLLDAEFVQLKDQLIQIRVAGTGSFEAIERLLLENRAAAAQTEAQYREMNAALTGAGGLGTQIVSGIAKEFANLKSQVASFLVAYLGFQQVITQIQKDIHLNYVLSDQLSQLEIYLKGDKKAVDDLFQSLKQLDTRTSLESLVDIATIVAKKGVVKEEILGVTQALDTLFVVLGKEVGNPHEAVASLVKLVNVYSEDKHVTAKNINDIGAAIQKLTSSGVATGDFLINFSERLAGVRGITGITIQNVLGLGAALQELGQRNESASTAAQKLILDMFLKPAKYAAAAKESIEDFSKELSTSPIEALIKVAAALKEPGQQTTELVAAFNEVGIHGSRVIGVLGDITGNAEYMRKRIVDANKAFGDQASILAAAEIKQHNLASSLDRVKKQFELIGTSKGFQITLEAISKGLVILIKSLPTIISLLTILATAWAVNNTKLIINNGLLALQYIRMAALRVALAVLTAAQYAYTTAITIGTAALRVAAFAAKAFGISISITPLGAAITAFVLLSTAVLAFGQRIDSAKEKLNQAITTQKLLIDIQNEAKKKLNETIAQEQVYISLLKDKNISQQTQKKALQDLIALAPDYLSALNQQNIATSEGKRIVDSYNTALYATLKAEASVSRARKEREKLENLTTLRQQVDYAIAGGGGVDLGEIDPQILDKLADKTSFSFLNSAVLTYGKLFNKKLDDKDQLKQLQGVLDKEIKDQTIISDAALNANKATTEAEHTAKAASLKTNIASLSGQLKKLKEGSVEYIDISKKLEAAQTSLYTLLGTADPGKQIEGTSERTVGVIRAELKKVTKEIETATAEQKAALLKRQKELKEELAHALGKQTPGEKTGETERERAAKRLDDLIQKITDVRNTIENLEDASNNDAFDKLRRSQAKEVSAIEKKYADLLRLAKGFKKQIGELNELQARELNLLIDKQFKEISDAEYELALKNATAFWDKQQTIVEQQYSSGKISKREYEESIFDIEKKEGEQRLKISTDYHSTSLKASQDYEKTKTDLTKKGSQERVRLEQEELEAIQRKNTQILRVADRSKSSQSVTERLFGSTFTTEQYYANLRAINQLYDALQKAAADDARELIKIEQDRQNEIEDLNRRYKDGWLSVFDKVGSAAISFANTLAQISYNNIENQLREAQAFDDAEKKKRESYAVSTKEKDAIDKEYDQKQSKREREAAKKKQDIAVKLALLNTALAIIKTFAELGWPAGIPGAIIAGATGAVQVAAIKSQKFKQGGSLKDIMSSGGVFAGPSHDQGGIPFAYRGQNIEVEGQEGYVINKKSMASSRKFTVTGTPAELASFANTSNGGINFAPGASMQMFANGGSMLSPGYKPSWFTNTSPPAFIQDYYTQKAVSAFGNSASVDKLHAEVYELKNMMADSHEQLAAAIYAESTKLVVLDMNGATKAQSQRAKAVKLGTL